jgi:hypothetical protein
VSRGRIAVSGGHYRRWGGQLCRTRRQCSGRPAARRAAAAEPRRQGRPGQVEEEAAHVPGADGGGPMAWRGVRASADSGRPAAVENPVGQRTGGAAEGGGRGG